MATFLCGNHIQAMVQLEMKRRVEQRQIYYPVSALNFCHVPPWHCMSILLHLILPEDAGTSAGTHIYELRYS